MSNESILDKIKAEILELPEEMGDIIDVQTGEVIGKYISDIKVIKILDKYKAESEDKK